MKRIYLIVLLGAMGIGLHAFCSTKQEDAVWDFSKGHKVTIVGWPESEKEEGWNVRPAKHFKTLKIQLPGRPELATTLPLNVFVDRVGSNVVAIQINEDPVTQTQAIERLRNLANVWGWRWDQAAIEKWVEKTKKNDLGTYGLGDPTQEKGNLKAPEVSALIHHAIGDDLRPWYVQLHVDWPESIR